MITEIADIRVKPEDKAAFAAAIARAGETVICKAKGYRGHTVYSCVETPGRFVLMVQWDSIEDHNVGFRQSDLFKQWREIIGPYFAQPPVVEHFDISSSS
ncbi:antibiotic biosynthesis monooxygenase family protein [Ramlibacter sp.]|uniref:antibiotic biosynthesis monooxygenase family protein n=1 Tax=Ramlibacter sp. TaxID=1917967 RepID=UPI003D104235